jgi:hypothetical protein
MVGVVIYFFVALGKHVGLPLRLSFDFGVIIIIPFFGLIVGATLAVALNYIT